MKKHPRCRLRRFRRMPLVLGGGGVKIFGHLGVLKALRRHGIPIGLVTGVSAGSVVAAFVTNGYSPEQITKILLTAIRRLAADFPDLSFKTVLKMLGGGLIDISEMAAELAREYNLKPNKRLRIVAYNLLTRQPVIFEGTDYDLAMAVSASCSVPFVMRPVWHGSRSFLGRVFTAIGSFLRMTKQGILIDGSIHHPNPVDDGEPAIISKLGFVTQDTAELLSLLDRLFHAVERWGAALLEWIYHDPSFNRHVIILAGMPDVACLTFGLPKRKYLEMIDWAEESANKAISAAIVDGRIAAPAGGR